ncbi:hypothetical protein [Streptomyces sp. NPDC053048]|uniref:hypothetical protein n=1 Tax=Streptomyces sp. NPDC053048 TaxID=3365694 RepID=UPI0037D555C1
MSNEIPPGAYAVDTRTGRLGQVMDHHAGYLQLRPPRGGLEWNCPPEHARPVSEEETADGPGGWHQ